MTGAALCECAGQMTSYRMPVAFFIIIVIMLSMNNVKMDSVLENKLVAPSAIDEGAKGGGGSVSNTKWTLEPNLGFDSFNSVGNSVNDLDDKQWLFIFGTGRSGSTTLLQMVNAISDEIYIGGENAGIALDLRKMYNKGTNFDRDKTGAWKSKPLDKDALKGAVREIMSTCEFLAREQRAPQSEAKQSDGRRFSEAVGSFLELRAGDYSNVMILSSLRQIEL